MSLPTLSISGASLTHMSISASAPCSLRYAAVESARTDDDASYRIQSQVEAEKGQDPEKRELDEDG